MSDFSLSRPGADEKHRADGVTGARRQPTAGKAAAMAWTEQMGRRRRAAAARRMEPLPCGCHDPESHHCKGSTPVRVEGMPLAAWDAARAHLRATGFEPILPARVAQLLGDEAA